MDTCKSFYEVFLVKLKKKTGERVYVGEEDERNGHEPLILSTAEI